MTKASTFKRLLTEEKTIIAPAVYDCLSAKIAESVGFKALFLSGLCLNVSRKGLPDVGTETRTETINLAMQIADSVEIPVFVDGADGYGGPLGIYETVRELERVGAAGCFIEDQAFPPQCPWLGPPEVISLNHFLPKLRAALDARRDQDFVILARTDSAATMGVEEAIRRGIAFRETGADAVVLAGGAPSDKDGLRSCIKAIGAPVMVVSSFDQGLTVKDYQDVGVKIVVGLEALLAAASGIKNVLEELHDTGFITNSAYHSPAFQELGKLLNWNASFELIRKYQPGEE